MPFKSDKQRRYLWSQKPEVARQIAHKDDGGKIADSWWNRRMAGVTQNRGYTDDLQAVREYYAKHGSPAGPNTVYDLSKPRGEGGAYFNVPLQYTPQFRASVDEEAARIAHNTALKEQADKIGFKFNEGGDVPMMDDRKPSKVTKKDRYGNSVTVEYEPEIKPIDQTAIIKEMINNMGEVPMMDMEVPEYDHPGEPKGTDTVPAWLTPGEFVVNKEATEIYGDEIKKMNDHGREIQKANKGMEVKGYADGGWVTDALLDRLAEVESGGDNTAVSKAGAVGKYQWLPSSAKQAGYGVAPFDPLNEDAARAATKNYLINMQKYHGFTPEETLRAYNWGPGNVINYNKGKRKDIPAEALNYPGKILGVENIEGVNVPYDMPTPTARPFQNGGPIPHFDTLASEYQAPSNIVPEIKTGGHAMFGGDQNLGGGIHPLANSTEALIANDTNIPIEDGPPESKWWHSLLGPKSKENLDIPLEESDKAFLDKKTAESEKLGSLDIAEEENQIADIAEGTSEGIDEAGMPEKKDETAQVDDFKESVKKKTIEKIDDAAKKDANSTGPSSDQKGPNANEDEVVKAAENDPSLIDKAGGFLKSAFGDLFDPKELARAAILYAGSRALGYSHSGSMQYIAKNYLTRVDAKAQAKIDAAATKDKRAFELAKTDKFTPGSVAAYKKSGNPADLVSKKSVAGAVPTGVTEQRLVGGKKISVQQVKLPDGSIGYNIPGKGNVTKAQLENATKPYDPSFDKGTSEYRTRRARAVKSNTDLFKEIQLREGRYKEGDEYKYKTGIIPSQAAHDFWSFAESYGIDPESDEAKDLMGAAYRQAIAQSTIKGAPVAKNLKPFLEASYIRQQTGAPELFQVNPDKDAKETEKYVRSDKMQQLTSVLDSIGQRVLPKSTKTDARNQIINSLVSDWGNLPEKEQKQWNRKANKGIETGFYLYAKSKSEEYLMNNKLGE